MGGSTPPPPEEEDVSLYSMYEGDGMGDKKAKASDVIYVQLKLRDLGYSLDCDTKYGPETSRAVQAFSQDVGTHVVNNGKQLTGRIGYHLDKEWNALQNGTPGLHAHDVPPVSIQIPGQTVLIPTGRTTPQS